jgi:gluconolactonase
MPRQEGIGWERGGTISRRTLVGAIAVGAAAAGSRDAMAQAERGVPPSVVTSPPRDFGPTAPPNVYVFDPDIAIIDPLFTRYAG